jgi:hypothetical protein
MTRLLELAVCMALALVLSGCGGDDGAKAKTTPPPPSSPPPAPAPPPTPSADDAAKAKAKEEAKPEVIDDHSDDPWYDEAAAAKAAAKAGVKPGVPGEKKPDAPAEKKAAPTATGWQPDQALMDQLDEYQAVDAYKIRVPKGYNLIQLPMTPPVGTRIYFWRGPQQADGTAPFIQAVLVSIPAEQLKDGKVNFADAHAGARDTLAKQQREWQETPMEAGEISGFPASRVRMRGVAQNGAKVGGSRYVAQDGTTMIVISTMAPDANAETLKLTEAAILTFRKK